MKDNSPLIDRLLAFVFVIGLVTLALIYGAAALPYRLPLSKSLANAFAALDAWSDEWKKSQVWKELPPEARKNLAKRKAHILQNPHVVWDKNTAYPGYTLVTTGYLQSPYLIDMNGKIAYRWNIPYKQIKGSSCMNLLSKGDVFSGKAHLYPNGDILVNYGAAIHIAPYGCGIVKVDKNSKILWTHEFATHHDFTLDEHGNIFALARRTITDAPPGFEGLVYPMSADDIVKLSPDGKELGSISLLDAFHGTPFETVMFHGTQQGEPPDDFFHTNSVDVLPADMAAKFPMFKAGSILVSMRSISGLAVIDPDTRKVVWAYRGLWEFQHEGRFLPNGHIMVFDNRGHIENGKMFSRVIEFDPKTLHVTWHFAGSGKKPFFSLMAGRLQRLPNGNTLIGESLNSRILEVAENGDIVWAYALQKPLRNVNVLTNSIFTSTRYSREELPFLHD